MQNKTNCCSPADTECGKEWASQEIVASSTLNLGYVIRWLVYRGKGIPPNPRVRRADAKHFERNNTNDVVLCSVLVKVNGGPLFDTNGKIHLLELCFR